MAFRPAIDVLTPMENRILRILATEGLTDAEVAEKYFMSKHTVRNHMKSIRQKLKVASRVQAAIWAWSSGYVRAEHER